MKAYVGVEVCFHAFLTLIPNKGEPGRNLCRPNGGLHAGNRTTIVQLEKLNF